MEFIRLGRWMRDREVALVFCGERMFPLAPRRARVRLTPPRLYLPACLRMGSWGVYGDEVPLAGAVGRVVWSLSGFYGPVCLWWGV